MSVPIFLGSLVLLATCSDAAKITNKDLDKRQISPPLYYQLPQSRFHFGRPSRRTYFPPPRHQYNSAFKNVASIQPTKQLQSPKIFKIFNAQAQRRYTSYYYPHRTHYRDWSQKLVEASAYARKVQDIRKKELLQKQKTDPSSEGIKLFVAGVNRNGNVLGQWIDHGKIQKPNGRQNEEVIRNKPSQENVDTKIPNFEFMGSSRTMQQGPVSPVTINSKPPPYTKTSVASPTQSNLGGSVIGDINRNLQSQTQANSFLEKGSTIIPNVNEAILSDNLGGAALGPNAHSLLQPTIAQQANQVGALRNAPGRPSEIKQSNTNPQPKANSIESYSPLNAGDNVNKGSPSNVNIPGQGQAKNILSRNDQHPPVNTATYNMQASSAQNIVAPPNLSAVPVPPSQTKADVSNSIAKGMQSSSTMPVTKSMRPPNAVALDASNIEKPTAQKLIAGLASTSASRPQMTVIAQPSTLNAASASRNSVPGNVNRVQAQLDKELALKNILFPPPGASSNQVYGTASNPFQKQQQLSQGQFDNMTPTFPAFRYNANLPATGQTSFNSYRRNSVPRPPSATNSEKSIVPRRHTVPYKSSFPLMLHKISPYFKMKRNLKQAASEQAKARRRLLELQPIK